MLKKSRELAGSLFRGRYSSDFGAQLVVYALQLLSGVLVGAYVARYLGPSSLGIISVLVTLTAIASPLLDLGTKQVLIKMLAQEDEATSRVFWTTLFVRILLGVCIFLGLVITVRSGFFESLAGQDDLVIVIGLATIVISPLMQFECAVIAAVKNKSLLIGQIVSLVIFTLMRASCVYFELGLEYFLGAILLSAMISVVNVLITARYHKLIPRMTRLDFPRFMPVLAETWPLLISGIATMLYMRTDIVMIEYYLTEKEVGHYWVANRLLEILFVIPVAMIRTLSGKIYQKLKDPDPEKHQLAMRAIFQLTGSSCILAGVLAAGCGIVVIPFLYGADYAASVPVFCLTALALPAVGLGLARWIYVVHFKQAKIGMYATLTGLVTNVGLNMIMIPHWGILGAAVATVVGQYLSCVLTTAIFMDKWMFKQQLLCPFQNPMWGYRYLSGKQK